MLYSISDYLTFNCDLLALFFLIIIGIVSIPVFIYSFGYAKNHFSQQQSLVLNILTLFFVTSMALVVLAKNLLLFLVAWELMSLISYFLVVFEHHSKKAVQAGTIYIVMTHIATAFLIIGFMLIYKFTNSFDLLVIKESIGTAPLYLKNIVFLLLLIGFGTKAGIVPLHIWLPIAHPQAPSPISSLMSAVMIKIAIYGFLRFVINILGIQLAWWAVVMMIIGIVSGLVGVLYALMDHDIKKILAYSSIENIGIIFIGIGSFMLMSYFNYSTLAVLALAVTLFHLLNHSVFKSLLFLASGSILKGTGTKNIEKLGGLIRTMPKTAALFLIGSMAIAAIPPLNGFISEWLILQTLFLSGMTIPQATFKIFFGFTLAMLVFISALAASTFVKAFAITFLAKPRSIQAQEAKESPLTMLLAMAILASLCILFAVFSPAILNFTTKLATDLTGVNLTQRFTFNNLMIILPNNVANCPTLLVSLLLIFLLLAMIFYFCWGKRRETIYRTWDCGYYNLDARNEYTGLAFSKPFRMAFNFFLRPYKRTEKIRQSQYHINFFIYETYTTPVFIKYIYNPILNFTFRSARFMRRIQAGSIHLYLSYIFVITIILIVFMNRF